jgi:hypothetical protein
LRYDIVIVGYRLNASVTPAQALQNVLGIDIETAKGLTRQFPATVLTGLSQSRAERVAEQLSKEGAKVEVRESRLSLASEAEKRSPSVRPFPVDEESGNYAIGEILAPMSRHKSSAPAALELDLGPTTPGKRASREELDAALRDSLRPAQTAAPNLASVEHDAAFAGIQNFDEIGGYTTDAAALQVDEIAMRSIQRRPETQAQGPKRPSLWTRLQKLCAGLASGALTWASAMLWVLLIVCASLTAVGYALDPSDILGALQRELVTARKAAGLRDAP